MTTTTSLRLRCPTCRNKVRVERADFDRALRCPHVLCLKQFQVQAGPTFTIASPLPMTSNETVIIAHIRSAPETRLSA
jgi:hypothetical protein